MINAQDITRYDRTDAELQEFLLFSICVAGHNADSTARGLDKLLAALAAEFGLQPGQLEPFTLLLAHRVRHAANGGDPKVALAKLIKEAGLGCCKARANSFYWLVWLDPEMDLRTCTAQALEKCPGIGPKTSRFFLLHSRRDFRGAALDTHILKYLASQGYQVPRSTPPAGPVYDQLERAFLGLVPPDMSVADFDLKIWKRYAIDRRQVNKGRTA